MFTICTATRDDVVAEVFALSGSAPQLFGGKLGALSTVFEHA
jgi:hypothetical protein